MVQQEREWWQIREDQGWSQSLDGQVEAYMTQLGAEDTILAVALELMDRGEEVRGPDSTGSRPGVRQISFRWSPRSSPPSDTNPYRQITVEFSHQAHVTVTVSYSEGEEQAITLADAFELQDSLEIRWPSEKPPREMTFEEKVRCAVAIAQPISP